MRSILARYHEEQVWSDKIRSASTYGSLAVLGMNLVVFILAVILVEPWKRKRLLEIFETRVVELNGKNQAIVEEGIRSLHTKLESQAEELSAHVAAVKASTMADTVGSESLTSTTEQWTQRASWITEYMPEPLAKVCRDERSLQIVAVAGGAIGCTTLGWILKSFTS